jgi:hypothetical protein
MAIVKFTCVVCGTLARGRARLGIMPKYCSRPCAHTQIKPPRPRPAAPTRYTCEACGCAFHRMAVATLTRKYCSRACKVRGTYSDVRPRFNAQIFRDCVTTCWLWMGTCDRHGYGYIRIKGKRTYAHRASWLIAHGALPVGILRHTCDIPACVNPAHLLTGTQTDNNRDAKERGRNVRGTMNSTAKLTDEIVRYCRQQYKAGLQTQTALCERFGVTSGLMCLVIDGRRWKHVA